MAAAKEVIFKYSPLGMAIVRPDNLTCIEANSALCKMFGYEAHELTGLTILDTTHPDDREDVQRNFQRLGSQGNSLWRAEKRCIDKTGRTLWVCIHGTAISEGNGSDHLLAIFEDVTERKRSEDEQARQLEISRMLAGELDVHKLVHQVTELMMEAVGADWGAFFHDGNNEAGEKYTLHTISGDPGKALPGLPVPRNAAFFGPANAGQSVTRREDVTSNPPFDLPPEVHSFLAVPVVSRSGQMLAGLFFGHSDKGVFTEEHERVLEGVAGHAAVAIDNARLFARAEAAQASLRRSNADLQQFAYVSSHDLQEPLRSIAGFTQLLAARYRDRLDDDAREFIDYIVAGVQQLNAVIQDLLAYSRVTNVAEVVFTEVQMSAVLKSAIQNLRGAIEASGAMITHDHMPALKGDWTRLQLLIENLLSNGIKYHRPGEPPRIHVAVRREGSECLFSVQDHGIGIKPEYHERIFGLFKRLHGKDRPGTGIGLAICRKVVEQHSGRIWVESKEGAGATFFFTLPA